MCPNIGQKGRMHALRHPRRHWLHQMENSAPGSDKSNQPRDGGHEEHTAEKRKNRTKQIATIQLRSTSCSGRHGKAQSKRQSDPPSGDDAPEQSKNRGRFRIDQSRVTNGKIFYADTSRDLIVDNSVNDRSHHGGNYNADCLHGDIYVGKRQSSAMITTHPDPQKDVLCIRNDGPERHRKSSNVGVGSWRTSPPSFR